MSGLANPPYTPHGAIGDPLPSGQLGSRVTRSPPMSARTASTNDIDLVTLPSTTQKYHERTRLPSGLGNGFFEGVNTWARPASDVWTPSVSDARDKPVPRISPPMNYDGSKVSEAPLLSATSNLYSPPLPPLTPLRNQRFTLANDTSPHLHGVSTPHDPSSQVAAHLSAINDLIKPLLAQNHELAGLRKEVDLWKAEWARVDATRKNLEAELALLRSKPSLALSSGTPFTAVLIDGDGHIFCDELLQAGFAGGQRAAQALLSALPSISQQTDPSLSPVSAELVVDAKGNVVSGAVGRLPPAPRDLGSVIVQIFLNKSGLGTTLTKLGLISSWGVFDSFWQGFSSAHDLFTVIDVGPGKEATDSKIREHLRLYTRNGQCELILLGATHDNGYANVLSSLQTESRLSKLLLLKGYDDMAQGLQPYTSRVVSIPDLFRTTKLPPVSGPFAAAVQHPSTSAKPTSKRQGELLDVPAPTSSDSSDSDSFEWRDLGRRQLLSKDNGKNEDWKEAGKRKIKKDKKEEKPKGSSGISVSGTVRNLRPRPCHAHYLGSRGCKAGDRCQYGHKYKLNNSQMEELTILTKQMLCPYVAEGKCHFSDDECVYGHKCPRGRNCPFGDDCRFAVLLDSHDDDERDLGMLETDRALAQLDI